MTEKNFAAPAGGRRAPVFAAWHPLGKRPAGKTGGETPPAADAAKPAGQDAPVITPKQRRMIWALITEIARWQGLDVQFTAGHRKLMFAIEELKGMAQGLFSLKDASKALAADYLRHLVRFAIDWSIPTKKPLIAYTEDVPDYLAHCSQRGVCAVCGRPAAAKREAPVSVCAEHAGEQLAMGAEAFLRKYHFYIVPKED
jgi:hypothetical protein